MHKKDFRFFTVVFLGLFAFGALLSFRVFTNKSLGSIIRDTVLQEQVTVGDEEQTLQACSDQEKINLEGVTGDELRKLAEYQQICDSYITDTAMYFTLIPSDSTLDGLLANDVPDLLEFDQSDVRPILIMEPYTNDGLMRWEDIANGAYDNATREYFRQLRRLGMDSDDFAMIVPLPEPNVPSWGEFNDDPKEFGKAFTRIGQIAKEEFSEAEISILVNSQSYEADDLGWNNGRYLSYTDYLSEIPEGFIDQLGIQGFPWESAADRRRITLYDPNEFLAPDLAVSTLRDLKIRKLWFNTGTYSSKYSEDEEKRVAVQPPVRKAILADIAEVAETIANRDFDVRVVIFAEDKAKTAEATNWSYQTSAEKLLIRDFVTDLTERELEFGIADR